MLRILFVTQDDPFYIPEFFDEFVAILGNDTDITVCGVVIQEPLGKKSLLRLMKQMLDFYGWADFLRVGVRYAASKALNVIAVGVLRGACGGMFSLKHLLLKKKWNIFSARDVNAPEFLALVDSLSLDLIVSVAASQIFKADILARPRFGCINIHNSMLPKNRGMLPNFWALYRSDTEPNSGMTVHRMNKKLDDGEIILQEEIRLDPRESLHALILRTKRLNAHLVLKAIRLFHDGIPPCRPNDNAAATYNTFPTKEDVRDFKRKGLRLI